jgi:hypothetical protein
VRALGLGGIEHWILRFAENDFGRVETRDFGAQQVVAVEFAEHEAARADLERGHSPASLSLENAAQKIFAAVLQQRLVGQRARRYHAHDLALHRALAGRRVADLLADRDRFAGAHQLAEITVDRVVGHAAHRNRLAAGLSAFGQRDV